jgi:potassium efflux system protein
MGRITVKVGVSYDADPDVVQQILMSCAVSNQRVMATPEPHVFLAAFGDKALEFELRCIVDNVQDALAVKSELHFAILRRFRAASIGIPTVPAEVKIADRDGGEQPASQGSV